MKHISSTIFIGAILSFLILTQLSQAQHEIRYVLQSDFSAGVIFDGAVKAIGDVNGDGICDLVIDASSDDTNGLDAGSARVLSGADGSVIFTFYGNSPGDEFGKSVSGAGDVNGDGIPDIIVGAPFDGSNGFNSGSARILSGLDGSLIRIHNGTIVGGQFGWAVDGAGDVNGDGFDDVVVGAPTAQVGGQAQRGQAFVFSGFDGSTLFALNGAAPFDNFGRFVAGVGDVNGDGQGDFSIGAPRANTLNGANTGRARVYSGMTGAILFGVAGASAFESVGGTLQGVGDINNDGFDDVILGISSDDTNGTDSGSARVLSGFDGSLLYSFLGDRANERFGESVSGAGDVNGDGILDLVVGAPGDERNGSQSGSIRVFSGFDGSLLNTVLGNGAFVQFGSFVDGIGDINGDGLGEVVASASRPSSWALTRIRVLSPTVVPALSSLSGESAGDLFASVVRSAGDVNGDGVVDMIVGAPRNDNNGPSSGLARVISGLDNSILYTMNGESSDDLFGAAVDGVGDINNDGFDDFIVGAPLNDAVAPDSGNVKIYSGIDGSVLFSIDGANVGDRFGFAVCGLDDVDQDGHPDFAVSFPDGFSGVNPAPGLGGVRVYSGATASVIHSFGSVQFDELYGFSIEDAGDVDGDGVGDIVVGAPFNNNLDLGRVRVFSGANGTLLGQFSGISLQGYFGWSVDGVGDVNGDGLDDIVVGSPRDSTGGFDAGMAQVFSVMSGSVLHSWMGNPQDQFGHSVSGAGDFNGDGDADILVGAPLGLAGAHRGQAFVFSGSDGSILETVSNTSNFALLGYSVSELGDVNLDGFADVLVGSPAAYINGENAGFVRVITAPTLPILSYNSEVGVTQLELEWIPNGDINALTGTISCIGATPGSFGTFGSSLAPASIPIFGFPLLIAIDSTNLIDMGNFAYGLAGEVVAPNISRQIPAIAGSLVHIQLFEVSPVIRASNGIRLAIVL